MAAESARPPSPPRDSGCPAGAGDSTSSQLTATYLGVSFALFLATLPSGTAARHVASLQSRGRLLASRLLAA